MTRTLIITCGLLFIFNSDICDFYYSSDTQTGEWWDLRFKFYSAIWSMMLIAVFMNVDRKTKIIMVPVLAIFLGDLKDRVLFEYTERDWSDWMLVTLSLIVMILIWRNGPTRSRGLADYSQLDNPDIIRNDSGENSD